VKPERRVKPVSVQGLLMLRPDGRAHSTSLATIPSFSGNVVKSNGAVREQGYPSSRAFLRTRGIAACPEGSGRAFGRRTAPAVHDVIR